MRPILIMICLTSSIAMSQVINQGRFDEYESQKKDKAAAVLYWIVPGGGHFYAENNATGWKFVGATVGCLGLMAIDNYFNSTVLVTATLLIIIRIYDLVTGFHSVDLYNDVLRDRLGLSYDGQELSGLSIRLAFSF